MFSLRSGYFAEVKPCEPRLEYVTAWLKSICAIIIIVAPLYYAAILDPAFHGDGHEYHLQLWALASHLSPDIRLEDIEGLSNYAQRYEARGFNHKLLSDLKDKVSAGEFDGGSHMFRSLSGSYYGLHFWFYPALAVPIKWMLHACTANELKAFQIANAILVLLGLGYLFLFSSFMFDFKLATSLLLVGLGIPYYLRWPDPEVFTAVACFVMAVTFLERRLLLATFACGWAATQNPSSVLMIPLIFASQLEPWLKNSFPEKIMVAARFFVAGSLSFLPFVFFYLMYGTPSLIAKEGYLNSETVDFDRLYSLIFDLNQGMLVGAGWVMGLGILICFSRFYSSIAVSGCSGHAQLFRREDLLVVGMFVMAIGVLPQVNWNADHSVYTRYAFWLSMPLMVWTVQQAISIEFRRVWLIAIVTAQLATVYAFGGFSKVDDMGGYLRHNRLATFALIRIPWAYNPEPEIFVERTLGREVDIATAKTVVYRRFQDGRIKKVLVHETEIYALPKEVCGEGYDLLTEFGEPFLSQRHKTTRNNCLYFSGDLYCVPRRPLSQSKSLVE